MSPCWDWDESVAHYPSFLTQQKKLNHLIEQGNQRLASVRQDIIDYVNKHRVKEWRLLRRLEIMVVIEAGVDRRVCAYYLRCSIATVRRWSRPVEQTSQLLDKKRTGRPLKFTEAIQLKVIAFYCQSPLPGCRGWSLSWAANYLNQHPEILGIRITSSTIHRILRMHSLRPHRIEYFLHISDPLFFPKMEHIIQLYLNPPRYLFCFDECTGIQALERVADNGVTGNGIKMDFEYKRRGTRDLFCILEVSTGKVFGRCTENHRKEILVKPFAEHVNLQPKDEALHYICDNLAGHSTELFCRTVAELSGVPLPSLKTLEQRRQWLSSEEKRIVIHFVPYHGSWLNLVEIWFGILHNKCLKGLRVGSGQELSNVLHAFCDTWDEHFAHPFRWTYSGEGLVEKVVCRFTNWLVLGTKKMTYKFMTKQIQLMTNLVRDYWSHVPQKQWKQLQHALLEKKDYVESVIRQDKKAQRVQTAQEARRQLLLSLSAKLSGDRKRAA